MFCCLLCNCWPWILHQRDKTSEATVSTASLLLVKWHGTGDLQVLCLVGCILLCDKVINVPFFPRAALTHWTWLVLTRTEGTLWGLSLPKTVQSRWQEADFLGRITISGLSVFFLPLVLCPLPFYYNRTVFKVTNKGVFSREKSKSKMNPSHFMKAVKQKPCIVTDS